LVGVVAGLVEVGDRRLVGAGRDASTRTIASAAGMVGLGQRR
jgi:hypothetical protein